MVLIMFLLFSLKKPEMVDVASWILGISVVTSIFVCVFLFLFFCKLYKIGWEVCVCGGGGGRGGELRHLII